MRIRRDRYVILHVIHSTYVQARMNARRITFTPHCIDSSAFFFVPNLSL